MRIGFFGNTNNYPFMVARALRRMGHDVVFIVDRPEPLARPENRYPDIPVPYPDWVVDLSPLDIHVPQLEPLPGRARAVEILRSCDAVFLNNMGPSLSPDVGRPSIVILTGSDLEDYADFGYVLRYLRYVWKGSRWRPLGHARENLNNIRDQVLYMTRLIAAQRRGIRDAATVSYMAEGLIPRADAMLARLGKSGAKRIFLLMTDLEKIPLRPPPGNRVVRLFNVARLTWMRPAGRARQGGDSTVLDFKGTDVMIRGIAQFVRKRGTRLDVRLVRKGRNVPETERLVEDEGLAGMVTWADIVFDQLGQGMIGMGSLDAMASGRPVIANGRPEIVEPHVGAPSPLCQARSPGDVCAQLERLVPDPALRERIGLESRRYVERHFSAERAARICLERLGAPSPGG